MTIHPLPPLYFYLLSLISHDLMLWWHEAIHVSSKKICTWDLYDLPGALSSPWDAFTSLLCCLYCLYTYICGTFFVLPCQRNCSLFFVLLKHLVHTSIKTLISCVVLNFLLPFPPLGCELFENRDLILFIFISLIYNTLSGM